MEERRHKDKYESAHLSLTSHKKRKKTKGALIKRNKRKIKNLPATSTRCEILTHSTRPSGNCRIRQPCVAQLQDEIGSSDSMLGN